MLKKRILTALALATVLLVVLFLLPSAAFLALISLVVLLTAHEWAALAGLRGAPRLAYAAGIVFGGAGLLWLFDALSIAHAWLLAGGVMIWLLLSLRVFLGGHVPACVHSDGFKLLLAPVVLWSAWVALEALRALPEGAWWVLAAFMVVWVADSAAFFSGRMFGKHKLAPSISPGKTIEGLLGALVGVAAFAWVSHAFSPYAQLPLLAWMGLTLAATLFSVMGDLHESQLKREAGVKDSGSLLPGHGGMFDRVDSLLAGAPIMAFGLILLGVVAV